MPSDVNSDTPIEVRFAGLGNKDSWASCFPSSVIVLTFIAPGSPDVGDIPLYGASGMQARGKGYALAGLAAFTALSDLWSRDHAAGWRAGIGGARLIGRDTVRDLLEPNPPGDGPELLPIGLPP